jgi:hypothetical protein
MIGVDEYFNYFYYGGLMDKQVIDFSGKAPKTQEVDTDLPPE